MHKKYFIALGGNIGDTKAIFGHAIEILNSEIGEVVKVSNLYRSKPMPTMHGVPQDPYLNAVLLLKSCLEPEDLLKNLQHIEDMLGRDRENYVYWGPRTIDLDIISVDNLVLSTPNLSIPHPRFCERDFVLLPIKDIDSSYIHPVSNLTINQLIEALSEENNFIEAMVN